MGTPSGPRGATSMRFPTGKSGLCGTPHSRLACWLDKTVRSMGPESVIGYPFRLPEKPTMEVVMSVKVYNARDLRWELGPTSSCVFPKARGFALVDRSTRWGNPFKIPWVKSDEYADIMAARLEVIEKYRQWLFRNPLPQREVQWLWGRHLVCHCAPKPCHADVLLRYVNFHYQPEA